MSADITLRAPASAEDFDRWAAIKSRGTGVGSTPFHAVAVEGYADMALVRPGAVELTHWLASEASRPEGSFVALEGDAIVGYAGMREHANGLATSEHGLTAVRRDRRRRGLATALKRTQIAWAASNGIQELVSWTQRGNEAMQALNRNLGYVDRARTLTLKAPMP